VKADERKRIRDGAADLGVDLDDAALDSLGCLLDRVYDEWQPQRNVTAVPREQAPERHLVDSLALAAQIPEQARVLDVGSGAGFPGLVLALARRDLRLTLGERSTWLAERLQQLVSELGLARVDVVARDLRPGTVAQERYEVVVSRAALKIPDLTRLARRALGPGGVLLLQLGPRTLEAYRSATWAGFREDACERYRIGDDRERYLVKLVKVIEHDSKRAE